MGKFVSNPAAELALGRTLFLNVTAKTANYTITSAESGTIFTNQGAGGAVFFTLPAQAAGLWYIVMNVENQDITVVADTVNTMATQNDIAADSVALSTSNQKVGGGFLVFSDATNWVACPLIHDGQVVTVA